MQWLNRHWPRAYLLLRYGVTNLNTAEHWNVAWERHGCDGFRASTITPRIRQRVIELIPRRVSVLDVGCGVGELLAALEQEKECRCFGVDISGVAIDKLRQQGLEGRVSALPAIPYEDERFDVVTCTETLEHVQSPKRTLAEMTRVLRTGGSVILSVPDGATDREEAHIHRYTPARLRKLLSAFLRVESIEALTDGAHTSLLARATKQQS